MLDVAMSRAEFGYFGSMEAGRVDAYIRVVIGGVLMLD